MKLTPTAIPYPSLECFVLFCAAPVVFAAVLALLFRGRKSWFGRWPGALRLISLNLVALAFFASAGFLIGECYYRFIYDTTDSFNYTFTSKRWFERYYHYNKAELRDNIDYPDDIPPGHRRVTFIGDSFTAAQGVKNVDDRFANLIRKRHPDWDVQVLAVEGLDTGPELEAIRRLTNHQYKMDLVVLVYCLNDVVDLMPEWDQAMVKIFSDWDTRNWLVRNSYFANTFYFRLKARRDRNIPDYFTIVNDAYHGPLWEIQQKRLSQIQQTVEGNGGKFAVVTFPFLHALGEKYQYQYVHDHLDAFWMQSKTPHLDLLSLYRSYTPSQLVINRLDAHPNEFAHALAADVIDKFLQDQLKTAPPPKTGP